jgi:hypothetical protein
MASPTNAETSTATVDPPEEARPGGLRGELRALGPGLVTGASDDDPSGIATYAVANTGYGDSAASAGTRKSRTSSLILPNVSVRDTGGALPHLWSDVSLRLPFRSDRT